MAEWEEEFKTNHDMTSTQATKNAQDTIAYGTKIVGGVSPGKGGTTHVGLPVYDTVREVRYSELFHPHCQREFGKLMLIFQIGNG